MCGVHSQIKVNILVAAVIVLGCQSLSCHITISLTNTFLMVQDKYIKYFVGNLFFIRQSTKNGNSNKNIYFNEMFDNWCWTSGHKFGVKQLLHFKKSVLTKNLIIAMRQQNNKYFA